MLRYYLLITLSICSGYLLAMQPKSQSQINDTRVVFTSQHYPKSGFQIVENLQNNIYQSTILENQQSIIVQAITTIEHDNYLLHRIILRGPRDIAIMYSGSLETPNGYLPIPNCVATRLFKELDEKYSTNEADPG